jgi:glutamyl-tRNA reductase
MTRQLPWMVGVQADNAGAEERDRVAGLLQRPMAAHKNWILLSTCHRVEVYGFGDPPQLKQDIRVETGERAVRHLIRVAAGLESAIIGEDEVLHQVREALASARASRTLDTRLGRMFETAIAAGRLARAERTVAGGNLAQRAVAWLLQRSDLAGRPVLIAGAGRMGSALAHAARLAGADITVASRNPRRAQRLARVYGGRGVDLASGAELATRSTGIAVALAGVWHEFQPADVVLPPIADISAPPAVLPSIRERLNGGFLGIDDLYARTGALPSAYIEKAEQIVDTKARELTAWLARRE